MRNHAVREDLTLTSTLILCIVLHNLIVLVQGFYLSPRAAQCRAFSRSVGNASCGERQLMLKRNPYEGSPETTETPPQKATLTSNFWYSVVGEDNSLSDQSKLPAFPGLDNDGPLPMGAYLKHGDREYNPKDTCRISVALDIPAIRYTLRRQGSTETLPIVKKVHNFLDAGLTTFQLKVSNSEQQNWAEDRILRLLRQETPAFALNQCHWTIPMALPTTTASSFKASDVRKTVLESLALIGGDAIDSLQIQNNNGSPNLSPYVYDVLEILEDMKREGLIRSICGRKLPTNMIRMAKNYGFALDSNQLDVNLFEPSPYSAEHKLLCQDLNIPLFIASPLAGGLLTNRYIGRNVMPKIWELLYAERRQWSTNLESWAARNKYGNSHSALWTAYQFKVLSTLETIALKHSVSIASIVLRWTLQLQHVASTVVSCRMIYEDDGLRRKPREQELREVFRFHLDDDDMEQLWKLTGCSPEKVNSIDEDQLFLDAAMENENGLYVPSKKSSRGSSTRTLWL